MASIYILLIFIAICICYAYPRLSKQDDVVYSAFAGSSDEPHDSESSILTFEKSRVIKLPDGTYANTKSFHRLRINGVCMSPIGINNGEEWLAKKINPQKSLRTQINKEDVLLIYLSDKKRYKIRRVHDFIDDSTVDTYSFTPEGKIHKSTKPHSANTIMGVVKYRLR